MKYEVRRLPEQDFSSIHVYKAKAEDCTNWYYAPAVWWDTVAQRANCIECSGPLVAMLSSCAHAKAVKRVAMKEQTPTPKEPQ